MIDIVGSFGEKRRQPCKASVNTLFVSEKYALDRSLRPFILPLNKVSRTYIFASMVNTGCFDDEVEVEDNREYGPRTQLLVTFRPLTILANPKGARVARDQINKAFLTGLKPERSGVLTNLAVHAGRPMNRIHFLCGGVSSFRKIPRGGRW
ncbi:hypothetical protein CPSG_01598 [Coccidioides posadasii str. Silveira]|uniref:Uncharacterized protein n=1 Tax=Coccidioides posadasii (strain RMSCC 757 / Silveira) TaxID=443226 RepID=E9CVW5_COCPS|nr:hypothetical protein CPSG_01598 [Coccidioides posadasii str. Silveira]